MHRGARPDLCRGARQLASLLRPAPSLISEGLVSQHSGAIAPRECEVVSLSELFDRSNLHESSLRGAFAPKQSRIPACLWIASLRLQ
jgi:hypothetical protein